MPGTTCAGSHSGRELEVLRWIGRKHPADERLAPFDVQLVRAIDRRGVGVFERREVRPLTRGEDRCDQHRLEVGDIVGVLRTDDRELSQQAARAAGEVGCQLEIAVIDLCQKT